MYCKKCKQKIIDDAIFCSLCGTQIDRKKRYVGKSNIIICMGIAISLILIICLAPASDTIENKTICILPIDTELKFNGNGIQQGTLDTTNTDIDTLKKEGHILATDDDIKEIRRASDANGRPLLYIEFEENVLLDKKGETVIIYVNDDYGTCFFAQVSNYVIGYKRVYATSNIIDSEIMVEKIVDATNANKENKKNWKDYLDY